MTRKIIALFIVTLIDVRFVLITLDFAFLDELFLLGFYAFQKDLGRLIVWILFHELPLNRILENRFLKLLGELGLKR